MNRFFNTDFIFKFLNVNCRIKTKFNFFLEINKMIKLEGRANHLEFDFYGQLLALADDFDHSIKIYDRDQTQKEEFYLK